MSVEKDAEDYDPKKEKAGIKKYQLSRKVLNTLGSSLIRKRRRCQKRRGKKDGCSAPPQRPWIR